MRNSNFQEICPSFLHLCSSYSSICYLHDRLSGCVRGDVIGGYLLLPSLRRLLLSQRLLLASSVAHLAHHSRSASMKCLTLMPSSCRLLVGHFPYMCLGSYPCPITQGSDAPHASHLVCTHVSTSEVPESPVDASPVSPTIPVALQLNSLVPHSASLKCNGVLACHASHGALPHFCTHGRSYPIFCPECQGEYSLGTSTITCHCGFTCGTESAWQRHLDNQSVAHVFHHFKVPTPTCRVSPVRLYRRAAPVPKFKSSNCVTPDVSPSVSQLRADATPFHPCSIVAATIDPDSSSASSSLSQYKCGKVDICSQEPLFDVILRFRDQIALMPVDLSWELHSSTLEALIASVPLTDDSAISALHIYPDGSLSKSSTNDSDDTALAAFAFCVVAELPMEVSPSLPVQVIVLSVSHVSPTPLWRCWASFGHSFG